MSRYQSQVREVINRNTVISLALEQGLSAEIVWPPDGAVPKPDEGEWLLLVKT